MGIFIIAILFIIFVLCLGPCGNEWTQAVCPCGEYTRGCHKPVRKDGEGEHDYWARVDWWSGFHVQE